jgi:hypothetical protein
LASAENYVLLILAEASFLGYFSEPPAKAGGNLYAKLIFQSIKMFCKIENFNPK